ncbi:hypothetical protein BH10CHL1_BH10CHL1_14370 [soil metagenome]
MIGKIRLSDYSLVGEDSALAIEKGLAEATWYASPIPKAQMRELLERRDSPAIRDTLLWFSCGVSLGSAAMRSGVVAGRSFRLRSMVCSTPPLQTRAGTSLVTAQLSRPIG